MKLKVYKPDGKATRRTVTLDESVFGIEPSDHAIWLDVRSIQANGRQGTHKTKERSEVRGGGAKPWRQKGTGRARVGTIRSPLWPGGGTIFGPRPKDYSVGVNRKTKLLARKSALTYKAREAAILVLEDFSFDKPKTSDMAAVLAALEVADQKVLLLTGTADANLYKSGRNLRKVSVVDAASASTYDLLNAGVLVFQESGLQALTSILGGQVEATQGNESESVTEQEG
ncbi:MAG TPA: 50S ribosomal protein L4 [Rhodothermales bacterium]|nr:50S ribosomal protein L4 [Rhodothermales bacterium]